MIDIFPGFLTMKLYLVQRRRTSSNLSVRPLPVCKSAGGGSAWAALLFCFLCWWMARKASLSNEDFPY